MARLPFFSVYRFRNWLPKASSGRTLLNSVINHLSVLLILSSTTVFSK